MKIDRICLLGGTGFVGRTLANYLVQAGYRLRVLTRHRESHRHRLILLPELDLIETNVDDHAALKQQFDGCDAVINLVGILNERGDNGHGFRRAHVELTRRVLEAIREVGVRRYIHMSALNADAAHAPSYYLRSKGEAEVLVKTTESYLKHTILQPSVIFGPEDRFLNRFVELMRMVPLFFPLACASSRFAPVYVEDVAKLIVRILPRPDSYGRRYRVCGPQVYTLLELVRYAARCAGLKRIVIPLGKSLSLMQAVVCDYVPGKPFSTDNFRSAQLSCVCQPGDCEALGIPLQPLEAIAPEYLNPQRPSRLDFFRQKAGRPSDRT